MHGILTTCFLGTALSLVAIPTWSASCFLSPQGDKSAGATVVQDGKEQVPLSGVRAFDNCERIAAVKGVALAQFLDDGKVRSASLEVGKPNPMANLSSNPAPVRAVARGVLAVLTDPKERSAAGQKFFDKPAQVGAPFGDVYIPPQGLVLRFVSLEGDARVQIADGATNATLLDAAAAQGLTLDRARLRAGGRYSVRVQSARGKLPPGAFEVVEQDLAKQLDQAMKAIDVDPLLDAETRPIARALVFEQEGLGFNRELALREMRK
jgi:hypothetical protein